MYNTNKSKKVFWKQKTLAMSLLEIPITNSNFASLKFSEIDIKMTTKYSNIEIVNETIENAAKIVSK